MQKSNLSVEVLVRGRPVKEFYHHDGNVYIEGRKNSNFELRIKNNNFNRVLVIPSVDGLSVMDGKKADSNSNGYIVEGMSTITIPGWRLDNSEVAQFFFQGNKGEGYAAQMEESGNEGVLGFMFFEEKPAVSWTVNNVYPLYIEPWPKPYTGPWYEWTSPIIGTGGTTTRTAANDSIYDSNAVVDCSFSADVGDAQMSFTSSEAGEVHDGVAVNTVSIAEESDEHVSVGFGEEMNHEVQSVSFNRGKQLDTFVIYYDTRKGLEQRGIEVVKPSPRPIPNPFPGDKGCTPPPNWKS
jgi:hypothetical protein